MELLDAEGRPIPGFTRENAVPLTGDSVRQRVGWQGGPSLRDLRGQPIAVRFHLRRSKLYSFQFKAEQENQP